MKLHKSSCLIGTKNEKNNCKLLTKGSALLCYLTAFTCTIGEKTRKTCLSVERTWLYIVVFLAVLYMFLISSPNI